MREASQSCCPGSGTGGAGGCISRKRSAGTCAQSIPARKGGWYKYTLRSCHLFASKPRKIKLCNYHCLHATHTHTHTPQILVPHGLGTIFIFHPDNPPALHRHEHGEVRRQNREHLPATTAASRRRGAPGAALPAATAPRTRL